LADKLSPATLLARAGKTVPVVGEPTEAQIAMAAAYHLDGDVSAVERTYGRQASPAWEHLEGAFGALVSGQALAFASGMAAATATLEVLASPDRPLAIVRDGYYGVRQSAEEIAARNRTELVLLPSEGADAVPLIEVKRPGLVWLESPTNPGLTVTDLRTVIEAAIAVEARVVLDDTLVTPLGRQPFEFGVDAAVYSATKYISGHSDLLLGLAVTADEQLAGELRHWRHGRGGIAGPFESWLCLRGMKTLELRLSRQSDNALQLARWLDGDGRVPVTYPGLPSHPGHKLARRDMKHFGGIVVIDLETADTADALVRRLKLFTDATSFGGIASSVDRRSRWSGETASPGLLRLSVGCESVEDLIADLDRELSGLSREGQRGPAPGRRSRRRG
jgi:cystathionine gamma-lyase